MVRFIDIGCATE